MAIASFKTMTPITMLVSALALYSTGAAAHTWIEQMQVIGPNGSYIGDYGYPRGYVDRTQPGFDGFSNKWQLPSPDTDTGRTRITASMLACHPSQRTPSYSSQFPKLSVAPGAYVAMKYLENGHVTQPWIPAGKPTGSGTVWIYGTYEPSNSETLVDVLSWTSDGKGGNGKGWLMSAQDYDDGRCYQINQSPTSVNRQMSDGNHLPDQPTSQLEQWCESDLLIPSNAPVGTTLTTYWVWGWGTGMQTEGAMCGKDEYYTTCSDFDIVEDGEDLSKLAAAPKVHTIGQQDPQTNAVSDYQSRTAHAPTPTIITKQECDYSSATTSSPPASLTEMTSLSDGFSTSINRPPMPKYRVGGRPADNSAQPSKPVTSEATSTMAESTPTAPATSEAANTAPEPAPISDDLPVATSYAPTVTVTAEPSIIFTTITVPESAASPSRAPASAVVSKDGSDNGIAKLMGKREAQVSAHGRLRHNVRFAP